MRINLIKVKRQFIYKKTSELTSNELRDISKIFFDSFGWTLSYKHFKNKYQANDFRDSFHVLVKNKSYKLEGIYTLIPRKISYKNDFLYALQSSDTCFPYKGVVNPFTLKKIVLKLINFSKQNIKEIDFIYGFPNKNYEKLSKFIFGWEKKFTLRIKIDFLPFLTYIKLKKRKNNYYNINLNEKETNFRLNSLFNFITPLDSNSVMNFWISKRFLYLQFYSVSNYSNSFKKIKSKISNLLNFTRLFIPSIFLCDDNRVNHKWQINTKLVPYNFYMIMVNEKNKIKEELFQINPLWNDVP